MSYSDEKGQVHTSLAHRIAFFVSEAIRPLDRTSEAIHSASNSCLISPYGKQSAISPNKPYESLTTGSVLSSSARHRWMSSSIE